MLRIALLGALLAIAAGAFVVLNPLLFAIETGVPHDRFFIFDKHFILDGELDSVKPSFQGESAADDFDRYHNHCLRVMNFAKFFMPEFVFEEYPNVMNVVAMSVAYHRVGLWTDGGTLNYLEPSVKQMEYHVRKEGIFEEDHIEIARQIIREQHKFTTYSGGKSKAINAIVNAVRKAAWADVTMGVVRFDLPAPLMEAAYAKIEHGGFHRMLLADMRHRLSPHSKLGQLEMFRIIKW